MFSISILFLLSFTNVIYIHTVIIKGFSFAASCQLYRTIHRWTASSQALCFLFLLKTGSKCYSSLPPHSEWKLVWAWKRCPKLCIPNCHAKKHSSSFEGAFQPFSWSNHAAYCSANLGQNIQYGNLTFCKLSQPAATRSPTRGRGGTVTVFPSLTSKEIISRDWVEQQIVYGWISTSAQLQFLASLFLNFLIRT